MLTVPVTNIAQPQNVTAFEITQVILTTDIANNTLASAQISYVSGNISSDTPPIFEQVGGTQSLSLNEAQLSRVLAAQPTLYNSVKALLYPAIEAQYGVAGTVV